MQLHLDILPEAQQRVWHELREIPPEFTLYGGTAIALQLGHRQSVDFDFFSRSTFVPETLYRSIALLSGAEIVASAANTLTCIVQRDNPVSVSFFGLPHLGQLQPALQAIDNHLSIASLIDLAATKMLTVQQRAEVKDYVDIDAVMTAGISLPTALSAAVQLYGSSFNPQITLKALSYFGDGDLAALPDNTKKRILQAVKSTNINALP